MLSAAGNAWADRAGGASGALWGLALRSWSSALSDDLPSTPMAIVSGAKLAVEAIMRLGGARVGDKTLMDTLVPAREAFQAAVAGGADFSSALAAMIDAAERGWHSTKDLQARIGRAARLGERSIGVLDAGATSCFLILKTLGTSVQQRLG